MSNEPNPKYIPTPEEVRGDSWSYCYGENFVIENSIAEPAVAAADLYYTPKDSDEHRQ